MTGSVTFWACRRSLLGSCSRAFRQRVQGERHAVGDESLALGGDLLNARPGVLGPAGINSAFSRFQPFILTVTESPARPPSGKMLVTKGSSRRR